MNWKSMHRMLSACAFAFFLSSASAQDLQQGQCDDYQCVILEVSVKLESTNSSPVTVATRANATIGSTVREYQTVVSASGDTCTKQVRIPRDVFTSITAVMRTISNAGDVPPALNSTQQAMLLFYSTLMQQTLGFQCSSRDLRPDPSVNNPPFPQNGNGGAIRNTNPSPGNFDPYGNQIHGIITGIIFDANEGDTVFIDEFGVTRTASLGDRLSGGYIIEGISMEDSLVFLKGPKGTISVPVGGTY